MADRITMAEGRAGAEAGRRKRIGPLDYTRRWWLRLVVAFTFLTLYAPIVTLIAYSFNDSRRNIVWRGFTFKYYEKAWNNDSLFEAFVNSLSIALVNTLISTILGVLVAIALWRFRATDPRRATTLANLALTDRLAGREGRARRRYARARRIWRETGPFIATMQIARRARSSLFHLRMETKHWDTYQDNMRIRMTAFARETAEALAALEQGQPVACRLYQRWRAEKPPVFDDTRKLLAAALMVGVGEKIPPEVKD